MIKTTTIVLTITALSLASASAQEDEPVLKIDLVNGALIEYSEHGNPQGEPVLLIHGGWVAGALRPLAMEPALQDFRLIVPHLRGFAGSSGGEAGADERAVDMRELLDSLDIPSAHIVGHSFGGLIAFIMAMEAPQAVRSLTLLEPAIPLVDALPEEGSEEYEQRLAEIRENAATEETNNTRGTRFGLERRAGGPEALDILIPGVVKQMYADAARRVRAKSVATTLNCHRLCGLESYPVLSQPILFLRGDEGNAAMPQIAEALEQSQQNLEIISIQDADHWFPLFLRSQTAAIIADFLRRHPL